MKKITLKCPAKINLDLKVFPVDKITGFHPIRSVMQAISLFDFITIQVSSGEGIFLKGNSDEIPYNEKNICYKAAKLFLDTVNKKARVDIHVDKKIPVCAGLAGGSTDASGVLYGLNKLFDSPLDKFALHSLAAKLGSDLNFCLEGGRKLTTKRGQELKDLPFEEFALSLVKPKNLKISAREAYLAFDNLKIESTFKNDLEFALIDKYEELKFLHSKGLQMSGSGPTYFILKPKLDFSLDNNFEVFENLKAVNYGVIEL